MCEEPKIVLQVILLFGTGILFFWLGRKLWDWIWNGKSTFEQFLSKKPPSKIKVHAISKMKERKVRVLIEGENETELLGFHFDMEPTAAMELSESISASAKTVASIEIVSEIEN